MKKLLAIILALCLALSLAACSASESVEGYEETPAPSAELSATAKFDNAFAAYDADAVVMTVDGSEVTWGEFFYWCYYICNYLETYMGTIDDYGTLSGLDETSTYADYVIASAEDMAVQYHALEVGTKEAGVVLSEDSQQSIQDLIESDIVSCCGEGATEEDLYEYLAGVYVTPETYSYINTVSCLYTDGFDQLFGKMGADVTDEDAMAFAEENGYITAKHILISNTDAEGAALDETALAAAGELAADIQAQIAAVADPTARVELFNELMAEYNSDTAENYYPAGYCFAEGEMVAEFYDAAAALEEYGVSDVVETDYGWHIILRMPTTPDDVVSYEGEDAQYTLRYYTANAAYDAMVNGWLENAEVVWTDEFKNLDLAAILVA